MRRDITEGPPLDPTTRAAIDYSKAVGEQASRYVRSTYPSFYDAVHRVWNRQWAESVGRLDRPPRCEGSGEPDQPYEPDDHRCYTLAGLLRVELHAAGITLSIDEPARRVRITNDPDDDPFSQLGHHALMVDPFPGGVAVRDPNVTPSGQRFIEHNGVSYVVGPNEARARPWTTRYDSMATKRGAFEARHNGHDVGFVDPSCGACFARDPIHEDGGSWYFWTETWADRMGPFGSRDDAHAALRYYCDTELAPRDSDAAWRVRLAASEAALYDGQDDADDEPAVKERIWSKIMRTIGLQAF